MSKNSYKYSVILSLVVLILSLALAQVSFSLYKAGPGLTFIKIFGFYLFLSVFILFLISMFFFRFKNKETDVISVNFYRNELKRPLITAGIILILILAGHLVFLKGKWGYSFIMYTIAAFSAFFMFKSEGVGRAGGAEENEVNSIPQNKLIQFAAIILTVLFAYGVQAMLEGYWLKNAVMMFFVLCFLVLFIPEEGMETSTKQEKRSFSLWEYLFMIIAGLAALIIRWYNIENNPPGCSLDEGLAIHRAFEILGGAKLGFYIADGKYYGPTVYYYILAAWNKLAGTGLAGSRMLAALAGALNVVFIYLLARELYSRRTALVSAILLTFSYYHLIYSRVAFLWIFTPLFATAAFYFLFMAFRKGKSLFYMLSGLMLGAGLYAYVPGKAVPALVAVYYLILLSIKQNRKRTFSAFRGLIISGIAASCIAFPLVYALVKYSSVLSYVKTLSVFSNSNLPPYIQIASDGLVKHVVDLFMAFTVKSSKFGYFNLPYKPMLDPFSSVLAVLGVSVIFTRLKKDANIFLALWLAVGLAPALLSFHPLDPNTQRAVLIVPALVLLVAMAVDKIWQAAIVINNDISKWLMPAVVAVFLLFSAHYNIYTYFVQYGSDPEVKSSFYDASLASVKEIKKYGDSNVFISPYYSAVASFGILLSAETSNAFYKNISTLPFNEFYNNSSKGVYIMGEAIYKDIMGIVKEYFPGAVIGDVIDPDYPASRGDNYISRDPVDKQLYHTYAYIPYEEIDKGYTLNVLLNMRTGEKQEVVIKNPVLKINDAVISARIQSLLYVPTPGKYSITAAGSDYRIKIDEKEFVDGSYLAKGLHKFRADLTRFRGHEVSIKWREMNGANESVIPTNCFINANRVYGLLGKYYYNGKFVSSQVDPTPNIRAYVGSHRYYNGQHTFFVDWAGKIFIEENGLYEFSANCHYDCEIWVDGKKVFVKKDFGKISGKNPVKLNKGKHSIKITYDFKGTPDPFIMYSYIQILYKNEKMQNAELLSCRMLRPY